MKANINIFWILLAFFTVMAVIYIVWSLNSTGEIEWAGTVAIALSGILSGFIAFYLARVHSAQGGELPEDRADANIDDGDPELGFYSPWSWWPVTLAGAAAITVLGVAVGTWLAFIGFAITVIALVGWVFEYYRGYFAR